MGKQSEVTQNVSLVGRMRVNKATNTDRQNKLNFNTRSKQRSYLFLGDSWNPEAKSSALLPWISHSLGRQFQLFLRLLER